MNSHPLRYAFLVLGCQVICGTRVQPTRLPSGRTKLVSAPDATTTLYLEASQANLYPNGVLTSRVDTFINDGTTTEFMTQHIGTSVDNVYAKIQTTSSREYYRIAPTASQDYNAPVRPTGLIGSSTSVDVNGPESTYYTVEEYRTYLDGHYAHLVSSISNVVSDSELITPTPTFEYHGGINSDLLAEQSLRQSLFSSYGVDSGASTRLIGRDFHTYETGRDQALEAAIENEIDDRSAGSVKRPRGINDDDLIAIESEDNEVKIDPAKPTQSLPTITVGPNGELNFPKPSYKAVDPIAENKLPQRQHRFLPPPPQELDRSAMDTVTYVGFVDFTTTIDDTVVIFRPKNVYKTKTSNIFQQRIEPTSAYTSAYKPTLAPSKPSLQESSKVPKQFAFNPDGPVVQSSQNDVDNDSRLTKLTPFEESRKTSSNLNALKSLLSSSAASRSGVFSRTRYSPTPSSSSTATTTTPPAPTFEPEIEGSTDSSTDLRSSIETTSDVELVFKTLYTTYTYFTTFFRESTTRVKSREEVISNVITLTNILKSTDLPSVSSSCELDSSCKFASTDSAQIKDFSDGFIGRPNTAPVETPRSSGDGRKVSGFAPNNEVVDVDAVLRTFYTTYTYFSTVFDDGTSTVSTRTEIYSNVQTESVAADAASRSAAASILPTSSAKITLISEPTVSSTQQSSISAFPIRRLEVSSIRNRQLQSDLTTPDTETTPPQLLDTTPTTLAGDEEEDVASTLQDTTTTTSGLTTELEDEEFDTMSTTETPALTEEVTEVTTTATTESLTDAIEADESGMVPKTLYTTFTYFTTLFKDGTSTVTSNLETVTNVMTDAEIPTSTVEPFVTFFHNIHLLDLID